MLEIKSLISINKNELPEILNQVEFIFYESSSLKSFTSEDRRTSFYKRWCSDYQNLYPEEFFVALEGKKVMGYLSGCSDSNKALNEVSVPGFIVFKDLFSNYPAHLHINFHPDARGKGLGSILVKSYMSFLKLNNIRGVHLITSPDSKNVSFYERLGFNKTETKEFNGITLFFMGCILIPE